MNAQKEIRLLLGLCLVIGLMFIARGAFILYNTSLFHEISVSLLLKAQLYGLRFDLAAAFIINLPWLIISLLTAKNTLLKTKKILFIVLNLVCLIWMWVDLELYHFMGKKLTADFFTLGSDIGQQLPQLVRYYWWVPIVTLFNLIILFKTYNKFIIHKAGSFLWGAFLFIAVLIGIRGGLQPRSISPNDAFIFDHYDVGSISLNSIYSLVNSIGQEPLKKKEYFSYGEERNVLLGSAHYLWDKGIAPQSNVVLIILESFAMEYVEQGYAPFLKSLMEKSLNFPLNMSNGRRSMEALPSILAGIPSLMDEPLHKSRFQGNKFYALPKILKENGYETAFFHGGKKGTMGFDSYCKSIGIEHYFALEDYPSDKDFDGTWGIFDGPYLQYFSDSLDKFKSPFFATVFTLTSHQPYAIPKEFAGKFPKGKLEIHESIGYVDDSLKKFFENAEKKGWYNNTMFVVTADHSQKLETAKYQSLWGRYRVPLLFFHPTMDLKTLPHAEISQHADIMPSLFHFLGVQPTKLQLFGQSVFQAGQGRAVNRISDHYLLLKGHQLLLKKGKKEEAIELSADLTESVKKLDETQKKSMLNEMKAFIQYYNNGLLKNDLYLDRSKLVTP